MGHTWAVAQNENGPQRWRSLESWLKEAIYGGRNVKPEFEVRDALLRYSKRPGKKVVKEV